MENTVALIIVAVYLLWNLAVMVIYGVDKKKAEKDKWRIKEKTLILLAFCFGGIGALTGMYIFRHKTTKPKFTVLVPVAIVVNFLVAWGLYSLLVQPVIIQLV